MKIFFLPNKKKSKIIMGKRHPYDLISTYECTNFCRQTGHYEAEGSCGIVVGACIIGAVGGVIITGCVTGIIPGLFIGGCIGLVIVCALESIKKKC